MPVNEQVEVGYFIIEALKNKGYELYGLDELLTNIGIRNMYKLYVNFASSFITLHFMTCPDHPHLVAGLADARNSGIWIGLLDDRIKENLAIFNDITAMIKSNFNKDFNFSTCKRCIKSN